MADCNESKKTLRLVAESLSQAGAFTDSDRKLLARYESIADAFALLFGKGCEVVLHSLEDISHSVIKIVNGHVTGRTVGSPITDLALKMVQKSFEISEDVIGSYYAYTDSGRPVKSVTILIRNEDRRLIGFLCVNIDLSSPLITLIKDFSPDTISTGTAEHYPVGVGDLVQQALAEESENIARANGVPIQEKNRRIVKALEDRGIFAIKGSVEVASKGLGITKYTIYKYLREERQKV